MSIPSHPRAVVTGAGSGLGRAFALELAKRGGKIVVADINMKGAEETASLVRSAGGEGFVERCDVTIASDVERLAQVAEERLGGVDVMINNAGVAVAGSVGAIPLEDWKWIVDVNLMGVVHGCHFFAPRLKKQQRGHIINVASAAGLVAVAGMAPYNMTKFGVVGLSEALYSELMPAGVGVTVLCPTFFPTDIVKSGRNHDARLTKMATKLMAASRLEAKDVARAALTAADEGKLFAVPMIDGRMMWRLKRLIPNAYYSKIGPFLLKQMSKTMGV